MLDVGGVKGKGCGQCKDRRGRTRSQRKDRQGRTRNQELTRGPNGSLRGTGTSECLKCAIERSKPGNPHLDSQLPETEFIPCLILKSSFLGLKKITNSNS